MPTRKPLRGLLVAPVIAFALMVGACGSEVIVDGPTSEDDDDAPNVTGGNTPSPAGGTGTGTGSGTGTGTSSGTSTGTAAGTATGTGTGGSGKLCGGAQPPCPPTEYCDLPGETCAGQGTCKAKPGGCTDDCPGACGCDGVFYCNACTAHVNGVDVDAVGDCD